MLSAMSNKNISIIASITIVTIMLDFIIADFFNILGPQLNLSWQIALFATITIILYGVCQYFLIGFARTISAKLKTAIIFNRLVNLTRIIQYALLGILLIIIIEIICGLYYHVNLLVLATAIGTLPGVAFYALLGSRLFSWYRTNRKNNIVLFLGLAASTGAIAMSGNIIMMTIILTEKPVVIEPQTEVNFNIVSSSKIQSLLFFVLVRISAIISTMFQWAGIALILHHFSKRIGGIRYWTLVCLPAVALFLGILPTLLQLTSSDLSNQEPFSFSIMAAIGASSIIFVWGLGYFSIAKSMRKIDQHSAVANYMTISAYGIMLTGFAFTAPIIYVTFPPFGLAAHSYLTLAAYLFSLGFYSSAISVSQDVNLRQSIRKFVLDESRLVDSIAMAQIEQEMQEKVLAITDAITIETGIESSLSDDDVKDYLRDLLKEIKAKNPHQ